MEKVTINKIERLKIADSKGLTSRDITRKFGKSNDYVELHIHDLGGELLETTPNYVGYSVPDQIEKNQPNLTSTLFIDPYQHLEDKGYTTGIYNVACNVHRKKVFSGLQADFKIHEISPSRTELKLKGLGISEDKVKKAILSFISEIEESLFNKDFTLNFGNNINILGINVAYHNEDKCALIKLYEPLPPDLEVGAEFWIVEEIIEPLEFKVNLGETPIEEGGIPLRGPNFRIDTRLNDSIPSQFKVYNDFLENTHSASLYNVLSHLSESVELSIDYTKTGTGSLETGYHFENFTHFGSAEERLKNFKYKLELLELYQRQIDEINTIQGSVSASAAVTTNISLIETKKAKLISGLDNYEKFLYYENHPYAWPKVPDFGIGNLQITGSTLLPESLYLEVGLTDCDVFFKPYTLRPTTSSQAIEWYGSTNELNIDYGGQILSASRFDRDNRHNLVRTIPEHVSMREENAQYLTFTNMIGHYFDQIWIYIDHIGQIRNAHNSFKDGISKDLVYTALSSLGVEAFDQFENEELFEYIIGTNKAKSGSFGTYDAPDGTTMITSSLVTCDNGGGSVPKGDITKEIWKRLYHNLPYLLKTKGTERGIKALMNCYGVPETILNVKEYGGPTTDSTTYKTFNYEKFSRALAGSSDTEGYFIKAPWASTSSLFNGTIESKPNRSEGKIIFSIGAVKELFNAPFPKTVELTATDLSVHTFTSNYDFLLHEESGLETAQSLAGAIDAHPLFSASVFVREDLYDPAHEKYNLDIEVLLTQHLQGVDGNTEIKGTLFEDTFTPACGNPQQFPEVEFLTKVDFKEGGGINNSTSTTTVVPGINTCSSKTLIENGIAADGSGNLINNGLFQDEAEFMDFVTDIINGYTNVDISLYSFESLTPSAIPLYLGEFQCKGINDYGLFVIECFKADDCVNIQSVATPTTVSPGTTAVGTITIPNAVGGNNSLYAGETVILTSADGTAHTFTLTGGSSVNSIGQDLMNAINADPNFTAINLNSVPQRTGYALEITTVATGSSANNPIQGSALNMTGDKSFMSLIVNGFIGGTDSTGGESVTTSNNSCNAVLDFYVDGTNLSFSVTTTQFTDYIVQGSTGDSTYDNYLAQAIPYAAGTHIYDGSVYVTSDGNAYNYGPTNSDYVFSHPNNQVFVTSTTIQASDKQGYLDPSEILNYCSSNCGNVSGTSDACYTNYTTFINALNADGIINSNIPGVNVDTKWSELKAPDIITHFPASSSCGCDNFETGAVTTTTVLTQPPTINTSIPLGQGAQNGNYGKFGARFYPDTNSSTFYNIPASVSTYFGGTNQNDGRLNSIGVWDGTNPWTGTNTDMNPMNEWIGFSRCINVPANGEYLIGLAGDNRIRFAVNGEMLIEKNTSNTENFNYWWVYKVNLTAGDNTIVLEGKNDGSIASFGCDIVGPFPTGTFVDEVSFQDIDNNGFSVNGNYNVNLEETYKNNIIFSSGDELGPGSDSCDSQTLIQNTQFGNLNNGGMFPTKAAALDQITRHPYDPNGGNSQYVSYTAADLQIMKFAVEGDATQLGHPDYDPDACIQTFTIDSNPIVATIYKISYLEGISLSPSQYPPFNNPDPTTQYNGNPQTYVNGPSWEDIELDPMIQYLKVISPTDFETDPAASPNCTSSICTYMPTLSAVNQINPKVQVIAHLEVCLCPEGGGGEFNTQTNSCPEGYLYNECTGLCEKTETITTGGGEDACPGMVINPVGNGTFATSVEFVDYFTDFNNGFYGQNIDEYYYESDEPLPWGTFVADQCTGSNGLPIRRVVGFRKDQSVLPVDSTLYTNYQTFVDQLNADGHGIEIPPTNFSNLTSAIITSSFEGSCQHKTLIQNPLTADGSFPTPGSGNTGMVDFLEYYSEQTNNIQSVAIDGFSFAVDPETLSTTSETCAINADMFVFYDMTSMDATTRQTAYSGFKAWHQTQVDNGYTGRVVHIQLYGERWVLWPAWILNPQDPSLTRNYDGSEWYGRVGSNALHNQTENLSFTIDDAMSGVDTHQNSTSNIRPLQEWVNDNNAILNADQVNLGKTIPTDPTDPAYNGIANDANAIVVCFADESEGIPNQVDGIRSTTSGNNPGSVGAFERRGTYHAPTDTNSNSHVVDWYEAGLYYERDPLSVLTITGFGKDNNISLDLNNVYTHNSNTGVKNTGTPEVTDLWKIDYIEATTRLATHGGNIATFVYPAKTSPGRSHRSFPLHVAGAIESGPSNDGLLPTAPACTAADLSAITTENPYYSSGYGGLDQFGFAYNVTVVSTADPLTFENIINTDLTQFLEESAVCDSHTETIFTDPNICVDDAGNYLFHIDNFFMDPSTGITTPFTKYTDYITEGQNQGYAITLGDTRLESQIGGPITADECICADACPNDLVVNDNHIITLTGSLFDQYNQPFTEGQTITQANNNGFSATVTSLDSDSNAIVINITSGTLTFTDPLVDVGTGAQYLPDPQVGEFIVPQPQGVFANYDEYMNFVSNPTNGFNQTNLNTLKFHLVDQSFTSTNTTVETEDCSVNADIVVFYDHTSMGEQNIKDALSAVNDYVRDLAINHGYSKNVYHFYENDEKYVRWGRKVLDKLNDPTLSNTFALEPEWKDNVNNQDTYDTTTHTGTALAPNGNPLYFGPDQLNGNVPTTNMGQGLKVSNFEDILVICFIDESGYTNCDYVPTHATIPPYGTNPPYGGTEPTPNQTTLGTYTNCKPEWEDEFGQPWTTTAAVWQTDHSSFVSASDAYKAKGQGNAAFFLYPTAANPGVANRSAAPSMLHYLAAITSGDNNNGLLANPPFCGHGELNGGGDCPNGTDLSAISTLNPYFSTGFGELDKHGWGINLNFPDLANNGSQTLDTDLTAFVNNSAICTEETVTETFTEVDILCTGSLSTDTNQYGLFTVEGFYQNALVEPSSTNNEYSTDSTFYTNWYDFITQKISETGATGIDHLNNNGASVDLFTTWNDLSNSVQTLGTTEVTITTTPGTPTNIFDVNNTYTSTFNNSSLNSGITGNPNQQLNWLIDNGHGQNIDGYYFVNDTIDETQSPYNTCTGNNLPAGGGAYSVINDFTFTCISGQDLSSASGTYTSWHTFIDTVNALNFVTQPGTPITTFNAGSACETGTDTGISGSAYTSSLIYQVTYNSVNTGTNQSTSPSGTVEENYINYVAQNHGTSNFDQYYFEDTGTNAGTCLSYLKYGTGITLRSNNSTSHQGASYGFFGGMMQSGTTYSVEYTTWNSFIDALNVEEQAQNKGANPFSYTDTLQDVLLLIDTLQDNGRFSYEGTISTYDIELNVESCECSTTSGPSTQVQQDIFTYQDDITDVLNYFNGTLEINYSANFIINTTEATCEDIPGAPIVTEETQSTAGNIPLYGSLDGGACVCVPEPTGGEELDGNVEFESCICCPESSSVAIGCLVAGEVSSSRCECSVDTYETVIEFVSASSFDIIPSSSAKMVEFRIKPFRLDKPEYTSLEACCDPIVTIPTASHLFSLFNESQPQTTPHLVLRPHTGSDVSASDDFRNFGALDLYKNGSVVGSTDIFPVYNGAFWNIFIGTKGESGSSSEVYFGAYQSNFLGHVTHLTASATFSEYERAASFGDTAYNLANNTLPASTAYFCGVPTTNNSSLGDINTFKYSGSLQEIKYYVKDFLTHDTLTKHALDPFQYAGNTVSSSWNNVYLRLPLGSNNKVDSASYNNNGLGIIQNFNPHPSFSLYESSSISSSVTNQVFSEVYETHRHLTPDTVGISTTSEKVRIDSGSVDRGILSFDIRSETSTLDRQPLDYNDLGVFFSPQAEINEDIVYTLGAFRMDDYIGDPTHQSLAEYPDLEELKIEYFRKYLNSYRQNMFDYIRLIQFIDHTLFKVVEQFVPAKANLKTGLLIEPHYLERQKFARQIPTFERLERDAEFDPYLNLEGKVEQYEACVNISDLNNENYYVWKGALTSSDNLHMSQSKYASDECNPYITLYDNFDPLYGNYVDCIISKEYYYVSKPPQFYQNDPVNEGINPNIGINPPSPSKPSGYAAKQVQISRQVGLTQQANQQAQLGNTSTNTGGGTGGSYTP